ncbi:MAG TPA: SPOR domain-containing protein [Ramlibacter sp.]|uniref:SPOR domain-containing protein n=1 Tax=Ramlibacter sp. TaxID=1917967 RepID=UPI002B7C3AE8|nr:SPOR domain-containing protein [Ramlibacter sp.]HVZ42511.1 SPOR domain-containing protein [Ramlibacter sp.]
MALFKLRKAAPDREARAPQPESIDAMRRRARHRLIGASVLVLIGIVGFPLLFDTQPRPIPVDIPIEIPDRNKVKPLPMPAPSGATASSAATAPAAATAMQRELQPVPSSGAAVTGSIGAASSATATASRAEEKPQAAAAPAEPPAPSAVAKAQPPKPQPAAEAKPQPKAVEAPMPDDGARARALLEGRPLPGAAAAASEAGRFIVQIGAFADAAKARETRLKVERAGLKTYTHVAETKEGKLIRVRVGPFATRAEADKAAEKIKGLDLQAKILTL